MCEIAINYPKFKNWEYGTQKYATPHFNHGYVGPTHNNANAMSTLEQKSSHANHVTIGNRLKQPCDCEDMNRSIYRDLAQRGGSPEMVL